MKAIIFAVALFLCAPALASTSSDHDCAQDLLVQLEALKLEAIQTKNYEPIKVANIRLDFTSIIRDSDRSPRMYTTGISSIYTNYGICDVTRANRYRMLRMYFETLLPAAVKAK